MLMMIIILVMQAFVDWLDSKGCSFSTYEGSAHATQLLAELSMRERGA